MRKVIAGINMTLDGFCDHTAITPDEEILLVKSAIKPKSDKKWFEKHPVGATNKKAVFLYAKQLRIFQG